MTKILVLDANQRSALAVTRSLGKKGIEVYTAEESLSALAGHSKFSKKHFEYPSPRLDSKNFISCLKNIIEQNDISILLPMTELTATLSLAHAEILNTKLPFADIDTVESLANKCQLMKTADSLGIAIPKTIYLSGANDLACDLNTLTYPIVLKPEKSWVCHEDQWRRTTVRFANNASQASEIIKTDWAFSVFPFMIQECIDGYGAGIFTIYDRGQPIAFFAHRRLREKPPSGGVSVLSESTPVCPKLKQQAETLLTNTNWHGVAMIEFKIAKDGTPYLMEVNTRFWGSLQLAIDAGVDFPYLLYQITCKQNLSSVDKYKTGLKLRWLLGDIDSLYLTLRDRQIKFTTKLKAIIKFLTPAFFSTRHEVNRLTDIRPFWYELKHYIADLFRVKS